LFGSAVHGNKHKAYLLLLVALVLAVFGNSLLNGFVYDDLINLIGKSVYREFRLGDIFFTLHSGIEYFPVRDLSFALDHQLWGEKPFGFHLTNLFFYCLNAVVVYFLAREVQLLLGGTEEEPDGLSPYLPLLAALLFVVHPVHCEVVNAVFNRGALMSGLFFFSASYLFLRFIRSGSMGRWYCAAAFICFLLVLLSKAYGIILPLVLLLFLAFSPAGARWKGLPWTAPFFVLSLVFYVQYKSIGVQASVIDKGNLGFSGAGIASKIAVAAQIPFFYLGKFFYPHGYSAEYDTRFASSLADWRVVTSLVALATLLGLSVVLRKRYPELLFGLGWYLLTLIPVLNFFATNPVVADRYAYLPSFGIIYLVAAVLTRLVPERFTRVAMAGAGGLVLVLGLIAFQVNGGWRNEKRLWQETLKHSPNLVKGYLSLGNVYKKEGDYKKAFEYYERMKELGITGAAYYDYCLGVYHETLGDYPAAAAAYRSALTKEEDFLEALVALGYVRETMGELEAAIDSYGKAVFSRQLDVGGYRKEASQRKARLLSMFSGQLDTLRKDAASQPDSLVSLEKLALRLDSLGYYEEALDTYLKMAKIAGNSWQVYFNAANACKKLKRFKEAAQYYEQSLALNPAYVDTLNNLGSVYRELKQYDRAIAAFEKAMSVNSNFASAPYNLACLYFAQGDAANASRYFRLTMERFPELKDKIAPYLGALNDKQR
jgi:pentatricopeptide repeat protein